MVGEVWVGPAPRSVRLDPQRPVRSPGHPGHPRFHLRRAFLRLQQLLVKLVFRLWPRALVRPRKVERFRVGRELVRPLCVYLGELKHLLVGEDDLLWRLGRPRRPGRERGHYRRPRCPGRGPRYRRHWNLGHVGQHRLSDRLGQSRVDWREEALVNVFEDLVHVAQRVLWRNDLWAPVVDCVVGVEVCVVWVDWLFGLVLEFRHLDVRVEEDDGRDSVRWRMFTCNRKKNPIN